MPFDRHHIDDRGYAVEFHSLTRRFGPHGVRHLQLLVPKGRRVALIGPAGSGKTTAARVLLNLLRPDNGYVKVFGMEPQIHEAAIKRRVGYAPQRAVVAPWMRVADALALVASTRASWRHERAEALLATLELDRQTRARDLSPADGAALALVGALACETDLLVLDEPLADREPSARRRLLSQALASDSAPGRSMLLLAREAAAVADLVDQVIAIKDVSR